MSWYKKLKSEASLWPSTLRYLPGEIKKTVGGMTDYLKRTTGSLTGGAGTAFLQGLMRRTKPKADTTSGAMSLAQYLKSSYPSSSATYKPPATTTPTLTAMKKRIAPTGGVARAGTMPKISATPSKKAVKEKAEDLPSVSSAPDEFYRSTEVVTKRGVYQRIETKYGGSKLVYSRANRPGDIFDNNEIFTHRKEWRPLSSEYKMGKGELYFEKPGMLNRLKEKTK